MFRFSVICTFAVLLLFFGVLLGMQFANQGMKNMKGYDDPSLSSAFSVESPSEGEILGQTVTSHDIEKKKQKIEELGAYNFFSSIGKKLSTTVSLGFEKLIGLISGT